MKKYKVYHMALDQEYNGAYCDEDYITVYEAEDVDVYLTVLKELKRRFESMTKDPGALSSTIREKHNNRIGKEMIKEMKKLLGDKYEKI